MPFLQYTRNPSQTLYLLIAVPYLLLLRLPYFVLLSIPPSGRPRPSWSFTRALVLRLMCAGSGILYQAGFAALAPPLPKDTPKDAEKKGFVWVGPAKALSEEIKREAEREGVQLELRVPGYWYGARGPKGEVGLPASDGEKVFYHLHCGGYVMDTAAPGGTSPIATTAILEKNVPFVRAFMVEYRLSRTAPYKLENAWPAALIDAIAGYEHLLSLGFTAPNILVGGDSAGGNLALALTRYLVKSGSPLGLLPSAGLLLLSPTVDWTLTHRGPTSSWETCQTTDYCVPVFASGYTVEALRGSRSVEEMERDAYLCPASLAISDESAKGLFVGYPKTLVLSGDAELQASAIRTLVERMRMDGGDERVGFVEQRDATHDVLVLPWYEPERSEALGIVEKWVRGLWE